jgi:predicted transcriptional regulator
MKVKITITIDDDIVAKVRDMSEAESRTISSQINKILKDYFAIRETS